MLQAVEVSESTLDRWRKQYGGMKSEEAVRLKKLEDENKRLKKMYSELSIDHDILKQGYGMLKKWQAQDAKKK